MKIKDGLPQVKQFYKKKAKKNKKTSIEHYARLLQRLHPDISKRNRIGVVLKLYKDFFCVF